MRRPEVPTDVAIEILWRCCPREIAKLSSAVPSMQHLLSLEDTWCALLKRRHGSSTHDQSHPHCQETFEKLSSLSRSAADVIQESLPWETRLPSAHWASPVVCGRLLGFDAKPLSVTFSSVPPGNYVFIWRLTVPFAMAPVIFFVDGENLFEEVEVDLLEITLCQDRTLRTIPPPFVVPLRLNDFTSFSTGFKAREGYPGPQIAFVELYHVELWPLGPNEDAARLRLLHTGHPDEPGKYFGPCAFGQWQGEPPQLVWSQRRVRCSRFGVVAHVRSARVLKFSVKFVQIPYGRYSLSIRQWQLFYPREYRAPISVTIIPKTGLKRNAQSLSLHVTKERCGENEYLIGTFDLVAAMNDIKISVIDSQSEVHGVVFDYFCLHRLDEQLRVTDHRDALM